MRTRFNSSEAGEMDGSKIALICLLLLIFVILPMCNDGSNSGKTDGVFESATKKIDKGQPLTEQEAKRINDILNYDQNKRK